MAQGNADAWVKMVVMMVTMIILVSWTELMMVCLKMVTMVQMKMVTTMVAWAWVTRLRATWNLPLCSILIGWP